MIYCRAIRQGLESVGYSIKLISDDVDIEYLVEGSGRDLNPVSFEISQ